MGKPLQVREVSDDVHAKLQSPLATLDRGLLVALSRIDGMDVTGIEL